MVQMRVLLFTWLFFLWLRALLPLIWMGSRVLLWHHVLGALAAVAESAGADGRAKLVWVLAEDRVAARDLGTLVMFGQGLLLSVNRRRETEEVNDGKSP